jgi:cysteine synthase A
MANIYHSVTELVGKTPLLSLDRYIKLRGIPATVLAKLECFNPAGSVKDRVALEMVLEAERTGILHADSVIIEPTSGNTGIGLAAVATARGYKTIIVMPDSMSKERQLLMKAYGAELVLTPGKLGMQGALDKADELQKTIPHAWIAGQFYNPANPNAHYKTTGPELWQDTDGNLDVFVAGIGTGGTVSGVSKYLKEQNPAVYVVGVEPAASPLLTEGKAGPHGLQGIGAGFVPDILDTQIYDEVIAVTEEQAYEASRLMGRKEGILVGISSGAALYGAVTIAQRQENYGKNIVVILPDSGDRYLTTALFSE